MHFFIPCFPLNPPLIKIFVKHV